MANGRRNLFWSKAMIYITKNSFIRYQNDNAGFQNGLRNFRSNLIMKLGVSQLNVL